jgi:CRP-like cAMP-binding protein
MISPELIRRYPFFSGLKHEQIVALAKLASEETVTEGHYFFHEEEKLDKLYLILEGAVAVIMEIPEHGTEQSVADQYTRQLRTTDVVISAVGPGEVFGISALVPPHAAMGGAKATTPCRVACFSSPELLQTFEKDCEFGYLMLQKAARVFRDRLQDMRIESLAQFAG